ncbi:uncharacterized protein L969DRAFT_16117 [Mixia osmundae IAM 14324]|uniref:Uncharacterized protein n=1 Tax=Mixia osmundae (strain CBS 9802 / IAM 14324 / JCM 22182 / KY 12970) TaxID=764103 RepID=G7E5I4_MIXOS|nr:uncharacterized protein L969DRAFT_16117 [Mixia osmundae IAM 14324]KEI40756.1 hypothetical protein L969DRAFT_16117 [Mixia osmundae IAM 14324]GAA98094.1 hypothetical protein E5Q_04777 [Mixia osmundae IAM 14324]
MEPTEAAEGQDMAKLEQVKAWRERVDAQSSLEELPLTVKSDQDGLPGAFAGLALQPIAEAGTPRAHTPISFSNPFATPKQAGAGTARLRIFDDVAESTSSEEASPATPGEGELAPAADSSWEAPLTMPLASVPMFEPAIVPDRRGSLPAVVFSSKDINSDAIHTRSLSHRASLLSLGAKGPRKSRSQVLADTRRDSRQLSVDSNVSFVSSASSKSTGASQKIRALLPTKAQRSHAVKRFFCMEIDPCVSAACLARQSNLPLAGDPASTRA